MTTAASAITHGQPQASRGPASLRRIKVLHVVPSLYGGGMERVMIEIMRASTPVGGAGEGCRVTHGVCILRGADDRLLSQCKSLATTWVLGCRKTRDWGSWKRLRQVVRDFEPDVVEALSTGAWVDAARAAGRRRQTKLVLTYHGQVDTAPLGRLRRWLNRWAAKRAAAVVSVSREAVDRMVKEWGVPSGKIVTLPNGIDVNRFRPANNADEQARIREKLGVPKDAKVVACVSNLMPIKALDVLLDAWRRLPSDMRSVRLLVIGDGPMRGELKKIAGQIGCGDSVMFLGNREDVPALLRAADLFVLSSRYEACSIAVLEAMSCGLASVVTDVGGNGELVEPGKTGWVVPPDRADLLAQHIAGALKDDPTRSLYGQKARTVVMEHYNLDDCARKYATLYHSLVLRGDKRAPASTEESACAE